MTNPTPPPSDDELKPISKATPDILIEDTDNLTKQLTTTEAVYLRQQLHHQRRVIEALWDMVWTTSAISTLPDCEGCLETHKSCINPLCKAFKDSNTLDQFIEKMRGVGDGLS